MIRLLTFLFLSLIYAETSAQGQPCFAFTIHPNGEPVECYNDEDMRDLRYLIYPLKEENNAGTIVQLCSSDTNHMTILVNNDIVHIHKGRLAVNTRNYNGKVLCLHAQPNYDSQTVYQTTQEHTVTIYAVHEDWLYVCLNDDGKEAYGWLEPDMQCPNPFTTCP